MIAKPRLVEGLDSVGVAGDVMFLVSEQRMCKGLDLIVDLIVDVNNEDIAPGCLFCSLLQRPFQYTLFHSHFFYACNGSISLWCESD